MNKTVAGIALILAAAALVPLAMIAMSRSRPSPVTAVHPVLDMDKQPRFKAQRGNPMFADGRAMRPRLAGSQAREDALVPNESLTTAGSPQMIDGRTEPLVPADLAAYDRITLGVEKQPDGKTAFVTVMPVPVSMDLVRRGQERFNVTCAACHGRSGYGDGMVARRAAEMQAAGGDTAAGWVPPLSYHTDEVRNRPVGHLYNTITNGIRSMPAHGRQVSVLDRWAIVAYIKALQRSQNAKPGDVP